MDGVLLVNKPKGWTSHDVVARVRSILRTQLSADSKQKTVKAGKIRVGHAGTLDPLATGLLIILVGSYTKKANEYSKLDKTYEVTMKLGEISETGDQEGKKTKVSARKPSVEQIQAVLDGFLGEIEQTPHKFSAIKVDGQRAYKLARAGKSVALKPRKITVHSLRLTEYDYPTVKFTSKVSSGTYIRSLVEDIGRELGTGAYMSDLKRTQIGEHGLTEATTIDKFSKT